MSSKFVFRDHVLDVTNLHVISVWTLNQGAPGPGI